MLNFEDLDSLSSESLLTTVSITLSEIDEKRLQRIKHLIHEKYKSKGIRKANEILRAKFLEGLLLLENTIQDESA